MSQDQSSNADQDRLDLDEVRRFLQRRWSVVLGTALGCLVSAAVVCASITPSYTATSQLRLDPRKQHVFGQDTVSPDAALDSSIVDGQIPIILSTRLLAKVINKEHLVDDPEFAGPAQHGLLDRLFGLFRTRHVTPAALPSLDGIDPGLQPIVLRLFDKIDVMRVAKSYVISIAISSRDPDKAMRLANSVAETYVEDQVDIDAAAVQPTAAFFEDRLGSLREQVRQSEQAVADYRKSHDLTTTTMDGKVTIGEQQLQSLNEQLALASTDTAEKLARFDQGRRFKLDGVSPETLPEIVRSPVITQLRTQEADLTRRASDLSAMYGPAYPAIAQMRAQRAGLDKAIAAEMKRLVSTLESDYKVAKAREDSLRGTVAALTEASGGDNQVGVKLRELERTNLANKALLENVLDRAKLSQEQSTFEEPEARLISPALEPAVAASPKTKLILPVALAAGLVLGLCLAALLDMRRRPPATARGAAPPVDARAFVLARIPDVPIQRGVRVDSLSYMDRNPDSVFAERIETLAAGLIPAAGESRIVMLAPLAMEDGNSSLNLCLAALAGAAGKRVLMIDADQTRHRLSSALGCAARAGLGEVILGDVAANKAVVAYPGFALLPAGQMTLSPAREAKGMAGFFAEARMRYDLVLVEGAAFDAGADITALAALMDGVAIVACWETLLREAFIEAVDAAAAQPNFLGIILNHAAAVEADELALAS